MWSYVLLWCFCDLLFGCWKNVILSFSVFSVFCDFGFVICCLVAEKMWSHILVFSFFCNIGFVSYCLVAEKMCCLHRFRYWDSNLAEKISYFTFCDCFFALNLILVSRFPCFCYGKFSGLYLEINMIVFALWLGGDMQSFWILGSWNVNYDN